MTAQLFGFQGGCGGGYFPVRFGVAHDGRLA
jgi:hypothetical protein